MGDSRSSRGEAIDNLISALDEARALVGDYAVPGRQMAPSVHNPGSLLQQCMDLCAQTAAARPDPVRMLHHFACTGGTLISKCLAAMPNTQLMSEVDPLSTLLTGGAPAFAPSDMATLMRQSSRGTDDALLIEMFTANLKLIEAECNSKGLRLLLRDHAHSHYCHGDYIPDRKSLREIVGTEFIIVSALTVRHPLDSYLSLVELGWISYRPTGFDEYCRRYLTFLDDHADIPMLRYEDFLEAPHTQMRVLCGFLELSYSEDFIDLFDVFQLSGDSGRAGSVIGKRPRREVDAALAQEADRSPHYPRLLQRLKYDH